MGFFKKKIKVIAYDKENLTPIIRSSICTGEQTAGFKHKQTGKFQEVMLIRTSKDLEDFRQTYGITEDIPKEY